MSGSEATRPQATSTAALTVAVPEWQGRVSPVFDVAARALLVELNAGDEETSRKTESLGSASSHERVRRLMELGVDVLVCGAISRPLENLLVAGGIRVVPLVCGPIDEVVQAFRDGTLDDGRFAMPGCCRKRRDAHHRRRRRGGNR